ncbi:hypothetical protein D3C80_1012370 [compost metagenome]
MLVLDHHANAIAQSRQLALVGQIVLDVRAGARNHLLEAGIDLQSSREETEHHSSEQTGNDHQNAVVKDHPFKEPAGRHVKVLEVRNHRHSAVVFLLYHFFILFGGLRRLAHSALEMATSLGPES